MAKKIAILIFWFLFSLMAPQVGQEEMRMARKDR